MKARMKWKHDENEWMAISKGKFVFFLENDETAHVDGEFTLEELVEIVEKIRETR